jgi:hypothetical protein
MSIWVTGGSVGTWVLQSQPFQPPPPPPPWLQKIVLADIFIVVLSTDTTENIY